MMGVLQVLYIITTLATLLLIFPQCINIIPLYLQISIVLIAYN